MKVLRPSFNNISYWAAPGLEIPYVLDQIKVYSNISILKIMEIVCKFSNVPTEHIKKNTRKTEIKEARQLFHYFAKKYTDFNLSIIGSYAANGDHSSVIHSIKTVDILRSVDYSYQLKYDRIRHNIESEIYRIKNNLNETR